MPNPNEPAWLKLARQYLGTKETPGPSSTPSIMAWAKRLGGKILGAAYTDDSVPWCGLFMAEVMTKAGFSPPAISLRASQWTLFGKGLTKGAPGAVLVFTRAGGGHVGLYVSEDATAYHVLGGNQGDAVTITRVAKDRLAPGGIRWPSGEGTSVPGVPVVRDLKVALSKNEA